MATAERFNYQAAKYIALTENYRRTINAIQSESGSIIDSGAARHVSSRVTVTDADDKCRPTSFTGKETWTEGNGHIPLECYDDLSGSQFAIDITDADLSSETVSDLQSGFEPVHIPNHTPQTQKLGRWPPRSALI